MKRLGIGVALGVAFLGAGFWLGQVTAETVEPGSANDPLVSKSYVDQWSMFRVVNVPSGHSATGEGGTEIVLRGGKATAIGSPLGGMLNATAGTDLPHGGAILPNHLLVVPRSDGRGLLAQTDLILMVKGPLTVKVPAPTPSPIPPPTLTPMPPPKP